MCCLCKKARAISPHGCPRKSQSHFTPWLSPEKPEPFHPMAVPGKTRAISPHGCPRKSQSHFTSMAVPGKTRAISPHGCPRKNQGHFTPWLSPEKPEPFHPMAVPGKARAISPHGCPRKSQSHFTPWLSQEKPEPFHPMAVPGRHFSLECGSNTQCNVISADTLQTPSVMWQLRWHTASTQLGFMGGYLQKDKWPWTWPQSCLQCSSHLKHAK